MKRLYLSGSDKKIAGVLGGVSETYDIDPTLIRLGFIFLGIATGLLPFIITYLIAWVVIPKKMD